MQPRWRGCGGSTGRFWSARVTAHGRGCATCNGWVTGSVVTASDGSCESMGLRAIYQKPNTSAPHPEHRIYPCLLRDLPIVAAVQYDGRELCVEALEEATARHGRPAIFNTDRGSQFTSLAFTQVLITAGIRISMDGKGRWMDNVFIERLWRWLKYECVYLHAFETGLTLHAGLEQWIRHDNTRPPNSTRRGSKPGHT